MKPTEKFIRQCRKEIKSQGENFRLACSSRDWMALANAENYSYHFQWLSRPIIQYPQDIVAVQEIIWKVKPDLIIETGIAHGGSMILSASMLALLDLSEAIEAGEKSIDPNGSKRTVVGIDIDIRSHNRSAIEAHPMAGRIKMIEGSSTEPTVVSEVWKTAADCRRVMVFLDSMHTHDHVLAELEAYAPMVSMGSYCIVFDTIIEDMPEGSFPDRPWGRGNNPKTAVWNFLQTHREFEIDKEIEHKLLITVAPDGFLRRIE